MKKYSYFKKLSIVFCVFIFAIACFDFLTPPKEFSETENRALNQMPKVSWNSIEEGRFQKHLEQYINDQFILKDLWVRLKVGVDFLRGKPESQGVYNGRSGFLLEKFIDVSDKDRDKTVNSIAGVRKMKNNIEVNALIAPTAVNVLENKLPMAAPKSNQDEYMDYLFKNLEAKGIKTIDVRKSFKGSENKEDLYYKGDHHWTNEGVKKAVKKTIRPLDIKADKNGFEDLIVSNTFEGSLKSKSGYYGGPKDKIYVGRPTKKVPKTVITYVEESKKTACFFDTKKLNEKDQYQVFMGGNHGVVKIKSTTANKKNLLIIKDSYGNSFIPYVAPYFKTTTVIDPRYFYGDISKVIRNNGIDKVLFVYNANTIATDTSIRTLS
ncbi:MAG: DHHW family protein [Anaerovoracaceae bacterium]